MPMGARRPWPRISRGARSTHLVAQRPRGRARTGAGGGRQPATAAAAAAPRCRVEHGVGAPGRQQAV
eukprot:6101640-Pyramimonas_sp.AAC.1